MNPLRLNRYLLCAGALAVILVILLHESLLGGRGLVPADNIFLYPPWKAEGRPANDLLHDQTLVFVPQHKFVHQQILHGDFPLWNPHLCCGAPNLGAIQGALLFPIQLLLSPIDPFYAAAPAAFLKLLLAGLFMMLYLRQLGASHTAALISGIVFSLCPFMIVWLGHPHTNCAMWLPLLLYFIERLFEAPVERPGSALRAAAGLALAFGLMFLGGHPPTMVHVTLLVTVYFLFRLFQKRSERPMRRAALLGAGLLAGFLLATPQLLPFLDYYQASSTPLSAAGRRQAGAPLPLNSVVNFLLPFFYGSPTRGFQELATNLGFGGIENFSERTGYVGILPLFLALCALLWRRCRFTWFYLITIVVSLLIIFGAPPFPRLLRATPVLKLMIHNRLLLFVEFGIAVLAGLGWDTLKQLDNCQRRVWTLAGFLVAAGVALVGIAAVAWPKLPTLDAASRTFLEWQFPMLACGLLASGLVALWPTGRFPHVPAALCLGWIAVDLLRLGMGYNPAIPRSRYYPATKGIEWLQNEPSRFRIIGGGVSFIPNTPSVFGLDDVRGWDFMTVRRYEELITGQAGDFYFYLTVESMPLSLPLLNAKYVMSPQPLNPTPILGEPVKGVEIYIYPVITWHERALLIYDYEVVPNPSSILERVRSLDFEPTRQLLLEEQPQIAAPAPAGTHSDSDTPESAARIVTYEPDQVVVEASLSRPGFLLLLDTWFPGWSATVNGRPAPVLRADYNFRAVSLPAGKSTVRFTYWPRGLTLGLFLCGFTALGLGVVWFRTRPRN